MIDQAAPELERTSGLADDHRRQGWLCCQGSNDRLPLTSQLPILWGRIMPSDLLVHRLALRTNGSSEPFH